MHSNKEIGKQFLDLVIDLLLSRRQQIRLGSHILYRASGRANGDPARNGEYRALNIAKNIVKSQNPVFFDVGAHVGEWLKESAGNMGSNLRLYAFEPSKETFNILRALVPSSNTTARIQLLNAALSDADGFQDLFLMGELAGSHSLHQRSIEALHLRQSGVERIKTYRGDTFCEESDISHIDFLKIDTEGHEMAVLYGFERLLSQSAIDFIQFEYGGCWIGARRLLRDAFEYLNSKGYTLGRIHPDGIEFLDGYEHKLEDFIYCNYLAVRPENVGNFPQIE